MPTGPINRDPRTGLSRRFAVETLKDSHVAADGTVSSSYMPDCNVFGWKSLAQSLGWTEQHTRRVIGRILDPQCPTEVRSAWHLHYVLLRPSDKTMQVRELVCTHTSSAQAGKAAYDVYASRMKAEGRTRGGHERQTLSRKFTDVGGG